MGTEHKIVMLPTEDKSHIGFLTQVGKERNDLRYFETLMPNILDSENQHLYIVSNDPIENDDWVLCGPGDESENDVYRQDFYYISDEDKKIIYTTNLELIKEGVLEIPNEIVRSFINFYQSEIFITDVKIEDNNILIQIPKKQKKETYSRKQVIQLLMLFDMQKGKDITTKDFDDWVDKNL